MGSSEVLQVRVCMGSDLVDMGSTALVDLPAGSAHAWQDRHDSTCVRSKPHHVLSPPGFCRPLFAFCMSVFAYRSALFAYCCKRHELYSRINICLVCICLWLL